MAGHFESLEERRIGEWDKGDHLAFALAGLIRTASQALGDGLAPGPRGWVKGYPEKLTEDLEFWMRKIKAQNINE